MVSNNFFKSDLNSLHFIVQNTMTLRIKELVIATLRDFFSKDSFYSYRTDHYGFPQTPDHTDLPLEAGLADDLTTRIWIGESFRSESVFYPALIIRAGSITSVPISFNRETGSVQWDNLIFEDGYGNIKTFRTPKNFIFAGAWEGTISIDVQARDLRSRDDLVDLSSILFVDVAFNSLVKEGLIVLGVSTSGPSEVDDRNSKLFKETITLRCRSEWRREIPIGNTIQTINTAVEFGRIPNGVVAANLAINNVQTLTDMLLNL